MKEIQLVDRLITLRPYQSTDSVSVFSAARESFQELSPFMPWCHPDYSVDDSTKWIEMSSRNWDEGIAYEFAITDSRDGSYLGGCGLNHINMADRVANLGYWVRTSHARQGVATKAALLLSQFGFRELKLNRIEILIAIDNQASRRVAEKVGATKEGILKNRLLLQDKVHDAMMFSLIPASF